MDDCSLSATNLIRLFGVIGRLMVSRGFGFLFQNQFLEHAEIFAGMFDFFQKDVIGGLRRNDFYGAKIKNFSGESLGQINFDDITKHNYPLILEENAVAMGDCFIFQNVEFA